MERKIVTIGTIIQAEPANKLQEQHIKHPTKRYDFLRDSQHE